MSNLDILREARRNLSYAEMIVFHNYLIGSLASSTNEETWIESVKIAKTLIEEDKKK